MAAAGIPATAVRNGVAARSLIVVAKGLYAVGAPWLARSPWARHRLTTEAAVRVTPDAIVSHASGAALLDLPHPAYAPKRVAMTVLDDGRTSRSDAWRRIHRGQTPAEQIVIRHGVPGFVVERVVIDSGREVPPRDALAIADGALRAGLTTRSELLEMRRHQRRWPGVRATNDVLLLADGRRENWLESASAWAISRWGLPVGVPQVNVFTPDGEFVGRPDLLWATEGLVGEADGVEKYLLKGTDEDSVRAALAAEKAREWRMTDLGLRFVRWTMHEAISGEAIDTRFRRLADPGRGARVSAVFRCSCCDRPLAECEVEAELEAWRRLLAREFDRKVW